MGYVLEKGWVLERGLSIEKGVSRHVSVRDCYNIEPRKKVGQPMGSEKILVRGAQLPIQGDFISTCMHGDGIFAISHTPRVASSLWYSTYKTSEHRVLELQAVPEVYCT